MSSEHRLSAVDLDAATLPAATAEIEHERRVAIFDLIEKNSFEPEGFTITFAPFSASAVDGGFGAQRSSQISTPRRKRPKSKIAFAVRSNVWAGRVWLPPNSMVS